MWKLAKRKKEVFENKLTKCTGKPEELWKFFSYLSDKFDNMASLADG